MRKNIDAENNMGCTIVALQSQAQNHMGAAHLFVLSVCLAPMYPPPLIWLHSLVRVRGPHEPGIPRLPRVARSELASVHLRTRMCGARVLTGVLAKWAARRSAVAFLRLAVREGGVGTNDNGIQMISSVDTGCGRSSCGRD